MKLALLNLLLCSLAVQVTGAPAKGTVAVLSSDSGAYMEAFAAFEGAYGEVRRFDISSGKPVLPEGTATVVTFGGRAATHHYPPGIDVIYCMAAGLVIPHADGRKSVKISLIPEFRAIFSRMKEIQPGIKNLWIFWTAPDFSRYVGPAKIEGARQGFSVTTVKVAGPGEVPARLRQSIGAADAFWLPPDPLLVTQESLLLFKEFSWGNGIPFYGSTKAMTREGAVASVAVSFREMGIAAADAARRMEAGELLPDVISPAAAEFTLNAHAARQCGVEFPDAVSKKAAHVFP